MKSLVGGLSTGEGMRVRMSVTMKEKDSMQYKVYSQNICDDSNGPAEEQTGSQQYSTCHRHGARYANMQPCYVLYCREEGRHTEGTTLFGECTEPTQYTMYIHPVA